jgi:hypothetical protein
MANRYFLNDAGDVCFYGDEVWSKIGISTSNPPDATSPDVSNITGETFSIADAQGKTVYSGEEIAVCDYKIGEYSVPATSSWATLISAATYAGVARIWCQGSNIAARINGGSEIALGSQGGTRASSQPINISDGDLVEVRITSGYDRTVYGIVIPFAYTNPG